MTKKGKIILAVTSVSAFVALSFIDRTTTIHRASPHPSTFRSTAPQISKAVTAPTHAPATRSTEKNENSRTLSPAETQAFVKEIDQTFAVLMVAGVNSDQINKSLSRLNERREAGVRAVLEILSSVPRNDEEVRERISMVDYLLYRSRWDEDTRGEAIRLATTPVPNSGSSKFKAAVTVERSEIIGRMAAIDWSLTSKALQSIEHPSTRRVAAAEAVFALAEQGMPMSDARKKVKEVVPEYQATR